MEPNEFLNKVYDDAQKKDIVENVDIPKEVKDDIKNVVDYEETMKGVFTCLISSLTYKSLHPEQDVRYHKVDLPNGYSGRTFDTKHVTPFLKKNKFSGAMKESGWLTRSIEQDAPFDHNFPGKIQKQEVKKSFLNVFDYTYKFPYKANECLIYLLSLSIEENKKRNIIVVNPVEKENNITISEIIEKLHKHFYFKYKSRGASILPVIALYSVYQCIVNELKRFEGMYLATLGSHNSCDRSSGATGDIVVKRENDDSIYEVLEIKFDIPVDEIMVKDVYKKISDKNIQRYYILSTIPSDNEEMVKINEEICKIRNDHGCQVIVNGVFETIKYYLRLLENTDLFLDNYVNNIQTNQELDRLHKEAWNIINSN